jgi:hypothetical protein
MASLVIEPVTLKLLRLNAFNRTLLQAILISRGMPFENS